MDSKSTTVSQDKIHASGVVRLKGKLPKIKKIEVHMDNHVCGKSQLDPGIETGRKNGLAWVVITWGTPRPLGKTGPVTIDQKGCFYMPHVLVARPDQEIHILNSDAALHTTSFEGLKNYHKTLAQAKGAEAIRVSFPHLEPVHLFCDVHDWMSGWIFVTDAPEYRITDKDGKFSLKGIKAGTKLTIWHEILGFKEIEFKGKNLIITFDVSDEN